MMKDGILQGAAGMGIALTEDMAGKMAAYWEAVSEANLTLNLTRIVQSDEVIADHFLDSLAPLLYGEELIPAGTTLLDVGTGAGFPGVPLAIAREDVQATLLDARQKKLTFVQGAVDALSVGNVRTIHARAEDVSLRYGVVCARAVAPLPKLCALLLPLVAQGGLAIMWKGPAADAEILEAEGICRSLKARLLEPFSYEIPNNLKNRRLLVAHRL